MSAQKYRRHREMNEKKYHYYMYCGLCLQNIKILNKRATPLSSGNCTSI